MQTEIDFGHSARKTDPAESHIAANMPLKALPYNRKNGIVICCRSCGGDMEETDKGYYSPIEFEHERFNRKCSNCRNID